MLALLSGGKVARAGKDGFIAVGLLGYIQGTG